MIPNYRGSWGSAGTFSFANAIEDTQSAVRFLRDPENVKKYRIDPKTIVLIGHSMGGFMAAYAAAHDPEVAALVMICCVEHRRNRDCAREIMAGPILSRTLLLALRAPHPQD